tara:strand:+ start:764 stop:1270 length:507 start_codon:yes stop_codon:yes gene_type:complete
MSLFKTSNIDRVEVRVISFFLLNIEDETLDLNADYQRGHVWSLEQKQNLILSIFNGLPIDNISLVYNERNNHSIEVVDGKQRITAIYGFFKNEFPIIVNGSEYFFKDLEKFDQRAFKNTVTIPVNFIKSSISELEKFKYFYTINFTGTEQSEEHRQFIIDKIKELEKN